MIEELYNQYLKLTKDAGAAATLVLAHVNSDKSGMPDSPVYTMSDAAKVLGVSKQMVQKLCSDGSLMSLRVGRCIRISRDALDQYMSQGKTTGNSRLDRHRRLA